MPTTLSFRSSGSSHWLKKGKRVRQLRTLEIEIHHFFVNKDQPYFLYKEAFVSDTLALVLYDRLAQHLPGAAVPPPRPQKYFPRRGYPINPPCEAHVVNPKQGSRFPHFLGKAALCSIFCPTC